MVCRYKSVWEYQENRYRTSEYGVWGIGLWVPGRKGVLRIWDNKY